MKSFKFIALIHSQMNLFNVTLANRKATQRTLALSRLDILRHTPIAEGVATWKHRIFVIGLAQGAAQLILCLLHLKSVKIFI
jgi:hypothetical protein